MSHITTAQLIELFCGDAPDGDALDAHVFDCDVCAVAYARLGELCATLHTSIPPVISRAHRDRMIARGMKLRPTPVEPGIPADATFSTEIDLLIHELRGDFANASRVDLVIVAPDGTPAVTFEHVPFTATEVLIACQRHYQHMLPGGADPSFELAITEGDVTRKASYLVIHHFV